MDDALRPHTWAARVRRVVPTPLLLLIALTTVLTAGTVSASSAGHGSETRVRAIPTANVAAVAHHSSETAGHVGCLRPPQPGLVSGSCVATNTVDDFTNLGGEFVDDAIRAPATRPDFANISVKIERQMQTRGWTTDLIDEAVTSGSKFPAVNKLGGANTPATRYVSPTTGQSVVIDNATGEIIQVGGPGFKYGP